MRASESDRKNIKDDGRKSRRAVLPMWSAGIKAGIHQHIQSNQTPFLNKTLYHTRRKNSQKHSNLEHLVFWRGLYCDVKSFNILPDSLTGTLRKKDVSYLTVTYRHGTKVLQIFVKVKYKEML